MRRGDETTGTKSGRNELNSAHFFAFEFVMEMGVPRLVHDVPQDEDWSFLPEQKSRVHVLK